MDQENKQPTDEELEELMETLKKLEEERQKKGKPNRPRGLFVIEFGGAYHPNRIINFLFGLLINITLSVLLIELFTLAEYQSVYTFIAFISLYSIAEEIFKHYATLYLLQYIIKTLGFVLYLGYLVIFYMIDQYVFMDELFNFTHEYMIVAFVTSFVLIRYVIGTIIRRRLRQLR